MEAVQGDDDQDHEDDSIGDLADIPTLKRIL